VDDVGRIVGPRIALGGRLNADLTIAGSAGAPVLFMFTLFVVAGGRYVVRLAATNELGSVSLTQPLTVSRVKA